ALQFCDQRAARIRGDRGNRARARPQTKSMQSQCSVKGGFGRHGAAPQPPFRASVQALRIARMRILQSAMATLRQITLPACNLGMTNSKELAARSSSPADPDEEIAGSAMLRPRMHYTELRFSNRT